MDHVPQSALSEREKHRADLALLVLTAGWGSTFVIVGSLLETVQPQLFLALRFAVASAAVACVGLVRRNLGDRRAWGRGAFLGLALYAGFALQTEGLVYTAPARSAFLTGLAVLLVPICSWAINGHRPKLTSWIGVVFATAGLLLLTEPWADASEATLVGDLLTIGCAVAYALHIVGTERWAPGSQLESLLLPQLLLTCVLAAFGASLETGSSQLGLRLAATAIGTGLVFTAGAYFIQTWAQARTTATRAALIYSLEPVFAAVYALAIAGIALSGHELAGAGLILAGVLVAELGPAWLARRIAPSKTGGVSGQAQRTVRIGDETDDQSWAALETVLRDLGAAVEAKSWALGGSQEIEAFTISVGGRKLKVESETYVGVQISGDEDLVLDLAARIARIEGANES